MKYLLPLVCCTAMLLPVPSHAQVELGAPALAACAAAATRGDESASKTAASEAEAAYRRALRSTPRSAEPRVGLARVISECRIPFANTFTAGRLIGESSELLEEALRLEPRHWVARYVLAMNHYRTPAFLGKAADAIEQFEILLRQQGDRADVPEFAGPYLYLGDLYMKAGRTEAAVALWRRGALLFPDHEGLREKVGSQPAAAHFDGPARGPATTATGSAPPPLAPPSSPPVPQAAVAADASSHPSWSPAGPAPPLRSVGPDAEASVSGERTGDDRPIYEMAELRVRVRRDAPEASVSATSLDRLQVLTSPGGMADVLQGLRTQGALTQASDGSDLFVRGGEPAEAPLWVDGARFIYPGTFESLDGGLFGVLDLNVMKDIVFSSGGFSSRYGNALSGVLDVQTQGRPTERRARVGLDLAGPSGSVWAPLGPTVGLWATGRVTDASILAWQRGDLDEFARSPRAAQVTLGVSHEPRERTQLKGLLLMQGDGVSRRIDRYGYDGEFRSEGSTWQAVLSGRHLTPGGSRIQGSLAAGERRSEFEFGVLDRGRVERNFSSAVLADRAIEGIGIVRAGMDLSTSVGDLNGMFPRTRSLSPGSPADLVERREKASHVGGFVETELTPLERIAVVAGMRGDRLPGEGAWTADPRISVAYRADGWTGRVGAGVFHQGRWRGGYELPDPGTPAGLPRRARHVVFGVDGLPNNALRIEAYGKLYDRYVAGPNPGTRIVEGSALGVDARWRWGFGDDLSGWATYSYLHARQRLEDGSTVPSRVDVTHGLTAVAQWSMGRQWSLGATGRFATGRPYTTRLDPEAWSDPASASHRLHDDRLPNYGRLDVRVTRIGTLGGRGFFTYVELLNALDRGNVMGYSFSSTTREATPIESFFSRRVAMIGIDVQLR